VTEPAGAPVDSHGDLYEVVVVRHGTREARRSDVFLNYAQYGEPDGPFVLDYYLWVVRSRTRTVLVDTGFARGAAEARGRQVLVDPAEAYRRLDVDTDSDLSVVVTHGHYDHIGNLGLFPNAAVFASAAEIDFWASPVSRKPLLGHFTETEELAEFERIDAEGRLCRFSGTTPPPAWSSPRSAATPRGSAW
jgi:glyoxylase-like metal-dependent hydrolase (beta-lactamase superfamily II)